MRKLMKENKASKSIYRKPIRIVVTDLPVKGISGMMSSKKEEKKFEYIKCQICLKSIIEYVPIWNCRLCRTSFHLNCIKQWADENFNKPASGWSCPHCRERFENYPLNYYCYCGKNRDPNKYSKNPDIQPHCCTEICGKTSHSNRGNYCTHPCSARCHPGHCPPCQASVNIFCGCQKTSSIVKCSYVNKNTLELFKCDAICNKPLNCGFHFCEMQCHHGPCNKCSEISSIGTCYCGLEKRPILCGSSLESSKFFCRNICNKPLSCGNHFCPNTCHMEECSPCVNDPIIANTCHCGRVSVQEIIGRIRQSCLDPIPSCHGICERELGCKSSPSILSTCHICPEICHPPPCPPCTLQTSVVCLCRRSHIAVNCKNFSETDIVRCQKICNRYLDCKKHKCQKLCCDSISGFHNCEEDCNNLLSCGVHRCRRKCHNGNCSRCHYVYRDKITCNCGSVSIQPPFICSEEFPICRNICPLKCPDGHNDIHPCHSSVKPCPPCNVIVDRLCANQHTLVGNVPCFRKVVCCMTICNIVLKCGHACSRICHINECITSDFPRCLSVCNALRPCGHSCKHPCHYPKRCPDDLCKEVIKFVCKCGNRSILTSCENNCLLKQNLLKDSTELFQVQGGVFQPYLPCVDLCAVIQRAIAMAKAFNLSPNIDDLRFFRNSIDLHSLDDLIEIFKEPVK